MHDTVKKMGPVLNTMEIVVDTEDCTKVLHIGTRLKPKKLLEVFAWSHAYMVGINPDVMCHCLNIDLKKKGGKAEA